jgi:hypothetical protein
MLSHRGSLKIKIIFFDYLLKRKKIKILYLKDILCLNNIGMKVWKNLNKMLLQETEPTY